MNKYKRRYFKRMGDTDRFIDCFHHDIVMQEPDCIMLLKYDVIEVSDDPLGGVVQDDYFEGVPLPDYNYNYDCKSKELPF